jgi:site-specific recombinase XerD
MKIYAVNELFARLSRTIGIKVVPHSLRHAFASETVEFTSIDVVRELMGHAHIATTEGYLHPSRERLRAAVEGSSILEGLEKRDGPI